MVAQSYEDAIEALNGLQTNAAVIQALRSQTSRTFTNVPATVKYLARVGISLNDLDKLSVIHVTGTKGKGSTCAFVEQLLRERGYHTGLYTSPHLVSVTERVRLDGLPLHKDLYTRYFWQVYNALYRSKDCAGDMPAYFKFLTVLALKVFLEEKVDVAVIEVGIGGEYDCTNVIRNPVACGITSLDLDHTSLLGNTIGSIAWHKAGIIKAGAGVFTVQDQPLEAIKVLQARAAQKQCSVRVAPDLSSYDCSSGPIQLGLAGKVQLMNASLALQLTRHWLQRTVNKCDSEDCVSTIESTTPGSEHTKEAAARDDPVRHNSASGDAAGVADLSVASGFPLSVSDVTALRDVHWPGRSQILAVDSRVTLFLDGAHTSQSMAACAEWFSTSSRSLAAPTLSSDKDVFRVLLFNSTGDRDVQTLMTSLDPSLFHLAIFTTNMASKSGNSSDQTNLTVSEASQHRRCHQHLQCWQLLSAKRQQHSPSQSVACTHQSSITSCQEKSVVSKGESAPGKDGVDSSHRNNLVNCKENILYGKTDNAVAQTSKLQSDKLRTKQFMKVPLDVRTLKDNPISENILQSKMQLHSNDVASWPVPSERCLDDVRSEVTATDGSLDVTHMLQLTPTLSDDEGPVAALVIPYIEDAIDWLQSGVTAGAATKSLRVQEPLPEGLLQAESVQVLVTGSLHLVGGVLGVVAPGCLSSAATKDSSNNSSGSGGQRLPSSNNNDGLKWPVSAPGAP